MARASCPCFGHYLHGQEEKQSTDPIATKICSATIRYGAPRGRLSFANNVTHSFLGQNLMRWLFTTFAVLSLLLCIATVALWVRSYYVEDSFGTIVFYQGQWNELVSDKGCIDIKRSEDSYVGVVPHALIAIFFGVASVTGGFCLPFFRFIRHRDRIKKGLCPHCGYDLRASKHRCPECGIPTPTDHKVQT